MINKSLNLKKLNRDYLRAQNALITLAGTISETFKVGTYVTYGKTTLDLTRKVREAGDPNAKAVVEQLQPSLSLTVSDSIPSEVNSIPDILKLEVVTATGERVPLRFTELMEWEVFTKNNGKE